MIIGEFALGVIVSTHSRLKAAGISFDVLAADGAVSTHSRLKAAGQTHFTKGTL